MAFWRQPRRLPLLVRVPLALLVLFGLLSLDWRHEGSSTPKLVREIQASGVLRVGTGKASLVPSFPAPVSGFNTRGAKPFHDVQSPLDVRALVMEMGGKRIGLVSVETVALPGVIREQVLRATADLHLDDLMIAATHAHSGIGGYWHKFIAEWVGLGPYDPKVESFFVGQIVSAVRAAAAEARPASLQVGARDVSGYSYNRDDGDGAVDTQLLAARFVGPDGKALANIVVFATHPTIINRVDMALSGDWPGVLMRTLEQESGATTLFFQGALGDTSWVKSWGPDTGQATANRFGEALARDVSLTLNGASVQSVEDLRWVRASIGLPKCDIGALVPRVLAPLASNAFNWATRPGDVEVSLLHLGPLQIAGVPGEPVAKLGIEWRRRLGGVTVVSLADDYVGYVEAPDVWASGKGETKRSYFGPDLGPRLLNALRLAAVVP